MLSISCDQVETNSEERDITDDGKVKVVEYNQSLMSHVYCRCDDDDSEDDNDDDTQLVER